MRFPRIWLIAAIVILITSAAAQSDKDKEKTDRLVLDKTLLKNPCANGDSCGDEPSKNFVVHVKADLKSASKNVEYRWDVSGGYLMNPGREVDWNLEHLGPGTYLITMTPYVDRSPAGPAITGVMTVASAICICDCFCPTINASGQEKAKNGDVIHFSAGSSADTPFEWAVENGEILDGQGTSSITVRVHRSGSIKMVRATVTINKACPDCQNSAMASTYIID
jgi:hypothetical protein